MSKSIITAEFIWIFTEKKLPIIHKIITIISICFFSFIGNAFSVNQMDKFEFKFHKISNIQGTNDTSNSENMETIYCEKTNVPINTSD